MSGKKRIDGMLVSHAVFTRGLKSDPAYEGAIVTLVMRVDLRALVFNLVAPITRRGYRH